MGELQEIEDELLALGCQVIAVSPDRPGKQRDTAVEEGVGYLLCSDSDMRAARAMGIAFQVEESLVRKYKESFDIDLEADSGRDHHQLPVPAVFLVDREGVLHFVYANPDYRVRLQPELLLQAARSMIAAGAEE